MPSPVPIRIPFNKPPQFEGVSKLLVRAVEGGHTAGGGPFMKRCEWLLSGMLGAPLLLTSSCTHALEMAAILAGTEPGDEVIVPSFTFVSTANAFALRGARLKFVDCDAFGNISLEHLETLVTGRTKTVVPVHYGGNSCDMERLLSICARVGAAVVEDAAQALRAQYKGQPLGTLGNVGCMSFHETKNVCAGEGGGLLVKDTDAAIRAQHLRDKGTNRREFSLGMTEKYTWIDVGSSWSLSDINAAYLEAQLQIIGPIMERREELWRRYAAALPGSLADLGVTALGIPPDVTPNYHLFGLVFPGLSERQRFIEHMAARGILTPFHYVALHGSPFGRQFVEEGERFPGTDRLSDGLVRLPLFYNLSDTDQDCVIGAALEFARTAAA
ncbi:MAG: dTDP-4-amino-4,6-dideoxygalactose transaminase [Thermoanaerobaculia bacterium]|nr:dTDP-4-amino-4,6-dideoxygalactose transaminase [Thermoanaerobaculia bacterium]